MTPRGLPLRNLRRHPGRTAALTVLVVFLALSLFAGSGFLRRRPLAYGCGNGHDGKSRVNLHRRTPGGIRRQSHAANAAA